MNTIARITAVILMIIGILVILGGGTAGATGILRAGSRALGVVPAQPAIRAGGSAGGLVLVIILFVQGLLVLALGEGLFLLADLASRGRS